MSITINGSGSISGLTAGAGVPASALSGQVPDANAPSGSVLQVVSDGGSKATVVTNSTSFVDLGYSVTLTPVSASSRLVIMFDAFIYTQTNKTGYMGLFDGANNTVGGYYTQWAGNSGLDHHLRGSFVSNALGSTSAVTIKLRGRSDGTGDVTYNGGRYGALIVMEIAA